MLNCRKSAINKVAENTFPPKFWSKCRLNNHNTADCRWIKNRVEKSKDSVSVAENGKATNTFDAVAKKSFHVEGDDESAADVDKNLPPKQTVPLLGPDSAQPKFKTVWTPHIFQHLNLNNSRKQKIPASTSLMIPYQLTLLKFQRCTICHNSHLMSSPYQVLSYL